ncbi:MAG: sigma 54-interacting transcriptional regulator [Gammaproteobacteria bacterium]
MIVVKRCHVPVGGRWAYDRHIVVTAIAGHARFAERADADLAYTGAVAERCGYFEVAHGGTLFLDELGTATERMQLKLLQVLERCVVQRVGEQRARQLDARVIMATNADLRALVAAGRFREDLFFRVKDFEVRVPPLADHRDDIPELAAQFLVEKAREYGVAPTVLTLDQLDRLMAYDWPGNVREFIGAMAHLLVRGCLPADVRRPGRGSGEWAGELAAALKRNQGKVAGTARELRVSRQAVYRRMKRERGSSDGDGATEQRQA